MIASVMNDLTGHEPLLLDVAAERLSLQALQKQLEAGIAHQRKGELDKARSIYESILRAHPAQPDALNLLGTLHLQENNLPRAIELLGAAVRLRPSDPTILNNAGFALTLARRFEEAVECLERAVSIQPDFIQALNNLGRALRMAGRDADAIYCCERLIEKHPARAEGYLGLARVLHDQGKLDEAVRLIRRAMTLVPESAEAIASLVQAMHFDAPPDELDLLSSMAEQEGLSKADRKVIYYSLGKIYDDLGNTAEAFRFFKRANNCIEAEFNFDVASDLTDRIIATFDRDFFVARADYGSTSRRPIFIVGMPRSGTTLTEQIISSHPDVFGGGELEYMPRIAERLREYVVAPAKIVAFPESALTLTAEGAELLARKYLWRLRNHSTEAARVTDKLPHNFQYVGLIHLLFPKAAIIHCRRDPIDTCLSIYMQNFNDAHAYKKDLAGLGRYYKDYARLMAHWDDVLPTRMLTLDYEVLVADPEGQIRRILDYLDLPWSDECLKFHEKQGTVLTASRWQVRQPIYGRSAGKWRAYAKDLAPLIEALGYADAGGARPSEAQRP